MVISNNCIYMEDREINFGMSYADAHAVLESLIFTEKEPDADGNGHIIMKRQQFYGLKGTCTLYFQKNILKQIGMVPDWSMYILTDKNGNRLPVDAAVSKIGKENEGELRNRFSLIDESAYGNKVFVSGSIYIITSISRSADHYSLIIKRAEQEQNMRIS